MGLRGMSQSEKYLKAYNHPELGKIPDWQLGMKINVSRSVVQRARVEKGVSSTASRTVDLDEEKRAEILADPELLIAPQKELAERHGCTKHNISSCRASKRREIEDERHNTINELLRRWR